MKTIFEKSNNIDGITLCNETIDTKFLNPKFLRTEDCGLPQLSELEVMRHYKELSDLMNDIEFTLGKFLSAGDKATVVMIKETLGLPCEVIILLVNYCVSRGKGNMRAIEKMAVNWSDKGIFTVEQADSMIARLDMSNNAWQKVSRIFGIKNIGLPTDAQLSYADTWCNEWKFSDDMLLEPTLVVLIQRVSTTSDTSTVS